MADRDCKDVQSYVAGIDVKPLPAVKYWLFIDNLPGGRTRVLSVRLK